MPRTYWLTRFAILRLLGVVYLVAFLVAADQNLALIGHGGLTPAASYLDALRAHAGGSTWDAFWSTPTIFWAGCSDGALQTVAVLGVVMSAVVVAGYANALALFVLWALYLSLVHVGQTWYGFGWETQLCETGFLAIFLCPLLDARPFPKRPPPPQVLWLMRWLVFRIMLGSALIKLRGDSCWTDLTCLDYHFETQPIPGPLSALFHHAPHWLHATGVVFNYAAELVAPFFAFLPGWPMRIAGLVMLAFQLVLISSGNLSFLNWLTIVPILACFDDAVWRRLSPRALWRRAEAAMTAASGSFAHDVACWVLVVAVGLLSIPPVANLLSPDQRMNTSFEPFALVNTYGAFGSVGRERDELVIEGTNAEPAAPDSDWRAYELPCKPGDPMRAPCWLTPYHRRLDWLMWFAAMGSPGRYPWAVRLVSQLLRGDPVALSLLDGNPFPDGPPRYIRVRQFRYRFAPSGSDAIWERSYLRDWLPPLARDNPRLLRFLESHGWH